MWHKSAPEHCSFWTRELLICRKKIYYFSRIKYGVPILVTTHKTMLKPRNGTWKMWRSTSSKRDRFKPSNPDIKTVLNLFSHEEKIDMPCNSPALSYLYSIYTITCWYLYFLQISTMVKNEVQKYYRKCPCFVVFTVNLCLICISWNQNTLTSTQSNRLWSNSYFLEGKRQCELLCC